MSKKKFTPIKSKKISEIVFENIKSEIISGTFSSGEKLPSERILAEQMGVSRPTIREAIKQLIFAGYLESSQGDGTYVKSLTGTLMPDTLKEQVEESKTLFTDLAEIRYLIEGWACEQAAKNRTDEDLKRMEAIVDNMSRVTVRKQFTGLDLEFHRTIAEMTKNTISLHLMKSISDIMIPVITYHRENLFISDIEIEKLQHQHREIFAHIKAGDPQKARAAMEEHIGFTLTGMK